MYFNLDVDSGLPFNGKRKSEVKNRKRQVAQKYCKIEYEICEEHDCQGQK